MYITEKWEETCHAKCSAGFSVHDVMNKENWPSKKKYVYTCLVGILRKQRDFLVISYCTLLYLLEKEFSLRIRSTNSIILIKKKSA